jgi:hypothetical protein
MHAYYIQLAIVTFTSDYSVYFILNVLVRKFYVDKLYSL